VTSAASAHVEVVVLGNAFLASSMIHSMLAASSCIARRTC
jgi:hypothetical protein